jgi:WD40 repeat protein
MREGDSGPGVCSEDLLLADRAVAQGLAPREAVEECLSTIRRLAEAGVSPLPRLAELLARKGHAVSQATDATVVRPSDPGESRATAVVRRLHPDRSFESKYAVAGEIARGGMGVILDGKDLEIRRELAIKVMRDGVASAPGQLARFVEEAQIQGQLEHPNICPVHEIGTDSQGRPYFTMKKVKGRSLAETLQAPSLPSLHQLLEIFAKVCDAVAFAHSKGVIHRDLKPANIMIGEFGEVLVMDWGLAKIMGHDDAQRDRLVISDRAESGALLSTAGSAIGTPSYMPPEQALGEIDKIDERSDIYALGGILYSILALRPPVEGATLREVLARVAENAIVPPTRRAPGRPIPPDLEAAAMKALAGDRGKRYASVREFKTDIEAFLEGRTLAAAEYSLLQLAAKWFRRNRVFAVTASVAAAILLGGAVFYVATVTRERAAAEAAARREKAEAARARGAEGVADRARRETEVRLAEGLVAQGDSVGLNGRWGEAKALFAEATAVFERAGIPPVDAELGMWEAWRHSPPPLLSLTAHLSPIASVAIAPDGRRAISSGHDSNLRLWDLPTGRVRRVIPLPAISLSVAFSPDGRHALSALGDAARLLDPETGAEIRAMASHAGGVRAVAFSPDGTRALSAGDDGTVRVSDVGTGRELLRLQGHDSTVYCAAFTPDGKRILSGGRDKTLRAWDAVTGKETAALRGHTNDVISLSVSRDGRRAVTGGRDNAVRIWDLESGESLRTLAHTSSVHAVAVAPNGRHVLTGEADRRLRLWDIEAGAVILDFHGHVGPVYAVALSPDGRLALSGGIDPRVFLWDIMPEGHVRSYVGHVGPVPAVSLSADGRTLLSGGWDRSVRLWDIETGRVLKTLAGHAGPVNAVALIGEGGRALTGGNDRVLRLWEIRTGAVVRQWRGHESGIGAMAVTVDGRRAISGSTGGEVRLWDLSREDGARVLAERGPEVLCAGFSGDGRRAIAGGKDFEARVWDVETGVLARTLPHPGQEVTGVALSPDGARALTVTRDGMVKLWDAATGRDIRLLEVASPGAWVAALSPDGRTAAGGSVARGLRLWDAETGRERRTFVGHTDRVTSIAFSPDSRWIVSSSNEKAVRSGVAIRRWGFPGRPPFATFPTPDAGSAELGAWYAFRGLWGWAAELLDEARAGGAKVSSLTLARALWMKGDLGGAKREFERALAEKEAPESYLQICLKAVSRD